MTPAQVAKLRTDMAKVLEAEERAIRERPAIERQVAARRAGNEARVSSKWQTMLDRLGPSERSWPACKGADGELYADAACPPAATLVEINPDYLDRSRPHDLQLIALTTPAHRYHGESDARLAARMAVWNSLDRAALAAMVR